MTTREDRSRRPADAQALPLTGMDAGGPVVSDARQDPMIAWLRQQASRALEQGRIDDAVPMLERLLALTRDPITLGETHLVLGDAWERREEWGRAVSHYRAAAEADPGRADAHYRLGLAHAHAENSRAAAEALRRAAEISPDDPEVARALGVALASAGQEEEADRWLRRAAALAPDSLPVLESLAAQHMRMGRFSLCGEVIQRAGELAPDNPIVRRLAKETSYLVEIASTASHEPARAQRKRPLRVVLSGAAGEAERAAVRSMRAQRFAPEQMDNARDAWRDYLAERAPRVRSPQEHAAALEYLIARLDFVDGCSREEVARRHGVEAAAVGRIHEDMVAALGIEMFDARYSTQPHPARHVDEEAGTAGLEPEEVFQALLEDEYREYCANHDRSDDVVPRLGREEFEDASVEYGSLLTRELMGLTLTRSERRRKRELERLLLVT